MAGVPPAEDAPIPPVIPIMELSLEEIERIQNTQHFKSQVGLKKIYNQETFAIWKIPNFAENWQIHLNNSLEGESRLCVDYGSIIGGVVGDGANSLTVKFLFNLMWNDPEDGLHEYGGLYFYFRPTEIPQSLQRVEGKYRLEILKANGQVWKVWDSQVTDWRPEVVLKDAHEFESAYYNQLFMHISGIISNNDVLGDADTLTLRLTFTRVSARILEYPNSQRIQSLVAKKADKVLSEDLEALLHDPTDADVQIKTKDGVVFKVHKLIIKRRVSMFRAMFETDMQENSRGVVETPEISSGAMRILLHFIYTGKLHQDWKQWRVFVNEVVNAANQYGLDELVKYYDHMLVTLCNDINVDDLLEVAKLHGLKQAEEDIGKWKRGTLME